MNWISSVNRSSPGRDGREGSPGKSRRVESALLKRKPLKRPEGCLLPDCLGFLLGFSAGRIHSPPPSPAHWPPGGEIMGLPFQKKDWTPDGHCPPPQLRRVGLRAASRGPTNPQGHPRPPTPLPRNTRKFPQAACPGDLLCLRHPPPPGRIRQASLVRAGRVCRETGSGEGGRTHIFRKEGAIWPQL